MKRPLASKAIKSNCTNFAFSRRLIKTLGKRPVKHIPWSWFQTNFAASCESFTKIKICNLGYRAHIEFVSLVYMGFVQSLVFLLSYLRSLAYGLSGYAMWVFVCAGVRGVFFTVWLCMYVFGCVGVPHTVIASLLHLGNFVWH